ncbi:beta-alanine-activating enzyme [Ischnura elegans]|uniref:beta-alanine-activating enzyme n=1 Tax=Ischnura elegans TaxID=197161 RepID=UPI001ED8B69A|nr:beta-alanine-activating enzyme [Ischnura elegans]
MAYAIQTSGTTGTPKVVRVPHCCIVPNILQLRNTLGMGPSDTVFLSSPITFDPSVVETFITLTSGACLLITPECIRTAPGPHLFQFLFRRPRPCAPVSVLSLTPSYAACLLGSDQSTANTISEGNQLLKVLCLGGEPCPSIEILEKWTAKFGRGTKVFSLYGITEVSCWASIAEVLLDKESKNLVKRRASHETDLALETESKKKMLKLDEYKVMSLGTVNESLLTENICERGVLSSDPVDSVLKSNVQSDNQPVKVKEKSKPITVDFIPKVSLGTPMEQTILEVRNCSGHAIHDGEGELYIGSDSRVCLLDNEAVGTLRKGGLTYRATGDIVYVQSRGSDSNSSLKIFYKRRKDGAVKRFGQWILIRSVESSAVAFVWKYGAESISVESACCVWCCKEDLRGKLGLFVKPSNKKVFLEDEHVKKKFIENLASQLTRVLPSNSWPDVILLLDDLPLTDHGKVDRRHLLGRLRNFYNEVITSGRKISKEPDELLVNFKTLWMKYLMMTCEPSPSDKFLLSGGDSLLALRLIAELEECMNCVMPPMLLVKLINGTFEEACCCIEMSELSEEVQGAASSSFTEAEIVHAVDTVDSGGYEEENVKSKENIYHCSEYTRGKVLRVKPSLRKVPTLLKAGETPVVAERWKYDLLKCVDASPVVLQYADSKCIVVVGSHSGIVAAVNLENGEEIFRCVLPDRIESSVCSTPCGKFLFVGCYDHNLYCIGMPEGKVLWSFGAEEMVKSSPLIVNAGTCVAFGSYSGSMYCINFKGHLIWKVKLHSGSIYSSPTLYQGSPDLSEGDENRKYSLEDSSSSTTSQGIVLCASLSGMCAGLTERDGRILWKNSLDAPIFASPLVYGHYAVFSSVKGMVICFSAKFGEKVWSFQAGGNVFSSFTTVVVGSERLIVFGCHDHYVYCLSSDGVPVWKKEVHSPVFATPFEFPVKFQVASNEEGGAVADVMTQLLAVCSTAGHLYILDCRNGTMIADVKVHGEIFSSPAVLCNQIVFGCRNNFLYCFTIS